MIRVSLAGQNATVPLTQGSAISIGDFLRENGLAVNELNSDCDFFVCVDYDANDIGLSRRLGFEKSNSLFIRNEPIIVRPENHKKKILKDFKIVFDMGRIPTLNSNVEYYPQFWPNKNGLESTHSRITNKIVLINGNKMSLISGELYSLRRKCIQEFEEIDLYGEGWGIDFGTKIRHALSHYKIAVINRHYPKLSGLRFWFKNPPNWLGKTQSKLEVLMKYRASLVIENSTEMITEKLFDSLFAGSIPIYVGPELSNFDIPKEIYIQVKPNIISISEGILKSQQINYDEWRSQTKSWLDSAETHDHWEASNVFKRISTVIKSLV